MGSTACLFVDGENFRHTISELFHSRFDKRDYLPKKADWTAFFDWLVEAAAGAGAVRLRTYWYVVEHLDFYPYSLPSQGKDCDKLIRLLNKSEIISERLNDLNGVRLDAELTAIVKELTDQKQKIQSRFNGWQTMHNGIATRHRAVEFRRAGGIRYDLFTRQFGQEKAVDVNLAVDLITLQSIYDTAIIVSGDQDYIPAVQRVKDSGKCVVNVAFKTPNGKLLPGGARRLNQLTDWSYEVQYEQFAQHLGLA
jgi:uncharacterized LabA/DUF88 family protein